MKFTFLGTGTSQGIPMIACDCPVCSSDDPRDSRTRSSLLISNQDFNIVIDTGPDFRFQMLKHKVKTLTAVLYTHEHNDHVVGLDDIRAFIFKQRVAMPMYASAHVHEVLRGKYEYAFRSKPYPGAPKVDQIEVSSGKKFKIKDFEIIPIQVMHGDLPIFGYRIGDFAYLTDVNYISEESLLLLKGVKQLAITALHKRKHHSHFNLQEALEMIKIINPQTAYLNHISHTMGKTADWEKDLPPNVNPAYDGLVIEAI